jgi:PPOX class probable F420-dependent enzyme
VDRDRALELLDSMPVATLTTIRADGSPRPVPIVFALLDDGRIVTAVDHKPKSTRRLRRLEDMRADPRVSVLAQHYENDWRRLWWVRVDGTAEVLDEVSADVVGTLTSRYVQYRDHAPAGPWILISPSKIVGWP